MFCTTKSDLNPQKNTQEEVYHTSELWRFDKRYIRYSGGLVALLFCPKLNA